ncbi:MAG: RNA polymerase sigma factor [Fibrobacteria bacterium]
MAKSVAKSAAGQTMDLEAIFRKYGDFVYRTCCRYFRDPADAEDVAQEVFLKLHRRLGEFRGDSALTTWIYRIAANTCIDALRSRKSHVRFEETGMDAMDTMVAANLASCHGDASLARIDLGRILAETDDRTREILFLTLAEGCSHEDVGEVVGLSKSAITKIINRFQKRIQTRKRAWFAEIFSAEAA